ncbi:MAG: hypothetical protein AAF992_27700, partial [Bacteroidota bacterium]
MKKIYSLILSAFLSLTLFSSCEEESDMAFDRVTSPVLLETSVLSSDGTIDEIQATFYELDKTGILDQNVGIDSIPVSNLAIEVFSGSTLVGNFTTDGSGTFVVQQDQAQFPGKLEYVGTYNEIAFRIA